MKIIGAGMAGLIAANVFRKHSPVILEAKSELPENHSALLRHKTDNIAIATSIPFKRVNVTKEVKFGNKVYKTPTIGMMNKYSMKVVDEYQQRSIASLLDETRFISPNDFVDRLALGCNIEYNRNIQFEDLFEYAGKGPVISTIPIISLARMLGMEKEIEKFNFTFHPVKTISMRLVNCSLYQTIYYPSDDDFAYRISITGNKAIYETRDVGTKDDILIQDFISRLHCDFGVTSDILIINEILKSASVNILKYGKINKLKNQDELKELIGKITKDYGIYSLGRFATWRNLLLDDVLEDCKVIQKLIESKGYYTGK